MAIKRSKTRARAARRATTSDVLDHQLRQIDDSSSVQLAAVDKTLGRQTDEKGASGTPNIGGYIVGEDYNTKLDAKKGIAVYDEMRRSSAQVQASLQAMKAPIVSANWQVLAPEHGDNEDKAIADAATRALFSKGMLGDTWRNTLQHLLTRLEFGVAAVEKTWMLDNAFKVGDTTRPMIRPRRLAPRLASTLERFDVDEDGQLTQLLQLAIKNGAQRTLPIPAADVMLTVHQKEGDNYWGRSILRSSYMHWFYVTQFYRIDAVRLDRYGVGMPHAELEKDHKASKEELKKLEAVLKAMRVHEKAYLITPVGVKVKILVPEGGRGGATELMTSVDHHNTMIARNVMAGFMSSEFKESLGSNRTETLKDFFTAALESLAMEVAEDLDLHVVRPFCDYNFNMAGREYPSTVVANISDVALGQLSEILSKLSQGDFITATDDIEDLLRKLLKLAPLPDDARGRKRSRAAMPGQPTPGDPNPEPEPDPDDEDEKDRKRKKEQLENRLRLTDRYTDPLTGRIYGRQPTAFESDVFALREVPDRLDIETKDLVEALADIRREQLAHVAAAIAKKDARPSTAPFTDIRPSEIAIPGKSQIEKAIKATQARVAAYGAFHVRSELQRQGAPIGTALRSRESYWSLHYDGHLEALVLATKKKGGITPAGADPTAGASKRAAKSALTSSAKNTAQKQTDAWKARILETATRLRRTGLQGEALEKAILDTLKDEILSAIMREAKAEVNEAFAIGRATEASAQSDEIDIVVMSALLDENTCDPCEKVDGEEMEYDSARYYETLPPYVKCEGNRGTPDACRCQHLFLYKGRRDRA